MVAQIYSLVSTTPAVAHPSWCTTEHLKVEPGMHQSADIILGAIGDTPVTVQRVQIDPEPGFPETRHEWWLSVGSILVEKRADAAGDLLQQFRAITTSLDLILGGA